MKLMKKMSKIVVAFCFLFIFGITVNAAESYKVGDKVLFGDFGGHVIENSDSNSNTVKLFVDGWNKSKEEWDEYWLSYNNDGNIYPIDEFDSFKVNIGATAIKEKYSNIEIKNMTISDLKNMGLNIEKYSWGNTSNFVFYVTNDIPEWLLHKNYNFLGTEKLNFNFVGSTHYGADKISLSIYSGIDMEEKFNLGFTDESVESVIAYLMNVNDVSYTSEDYNVSSTAGFLENLENAKSVFINNYEGNGCGYGSGKTIKRCTKYTYDIVVMNKSNLTKVVDKCADYSDSYKITYETNGGEKIDAVTVTGNKELTTPKKEGYIFDDWYTDSTFKTKVSSIVPTQKMKDSCLAGYNDVTVYAKWNKELKDEKVSVLGEEKALENVKNIIVKTLDKVSAHNIDVLKKFTAYDITLKDASDKAVQPNGKLKLSLEIPEGYDKTKVGIFGLSGDTLETYETTINGNYAEAEVEHFSTYIVGEKAEVKQEEKTTTTKDDDSNIKNPKTGDNLVIYFIFGLLLISGLVIVSKKLRTVK